MLVTTAAISTEQREALTIRFPPRLLSTARELKADRESLNDLVVEAVEREVRRRRAMQAYEAIMSIREQVETQRGLHPSSATLIRALRDGDGRGE
ncbi:MAG: YlcI/YnfO family protein [Chloroflexota bacterium]